MARKMVPFVKMIPSKERIMRDQKICQKTPPPAPPFTAGCLFTSSNHDTHSSHREFVQADVLHSRPNNREATGLRGEHVDLISPLPHITEETLSGEQPLMPIGHDEINLGGSSCAQVLQEAGPSILAASSRPLLATSAFSSLCGVGSLLSLHSPWECPCCPSNSGWCFLTLYGLPRKEEYS